MDADEYERQHMGVEGRVLFRDRQRERHVFGRLIAVPALVGAMIVCELDLSVIAFMGVVGVLGAGLDLALSSYRVVLTDSTLLVQHGLRTRRIPVAAIEEVRVAPYVPAEALVGRGVHAQSRDGSIQRYRAGGVKETVRVVWREGYRMRTEILATDRARELAAELDRARGHDPLRVRVELTPDERAAYEEVEAFLAAERAARRARG